MTLQFSAAHDGHHLDWEVSWAETATVGDLCRAVWPLAPSGSPVVDGRPVDPGTAVAEAALVVGSELALAAQTRARPAASVIDLQVLSGVGAGTAVALPPGRHVVGGVNTAAVLHVPGVLARPGELRVGDGVRIGGAEPLREIAAESVVAVGEALLAVAPSLPDGALSTTPGRRGTIAFNRRPRLRTSRGAHVIRLPQPTRSEPPSARLGWTALVTPVLFGVVMAILLDPRMALFALLGPVMMVAGWLDDRRRVRRSIRAASVQTDRDAGELEAALRSARARELIRLRRRHPPVATLAAMARCGAPPMWERRPGDDDFMQLVCGYGDLRWAVAFDTHPGNAAGSVQEVISRHDRLVNAPAVVDLRPGQVVGIAGDRPGVLDLARSLLCQAAVLHGPADVVIAVLTSRPGDWDWVKWLPHTIDGQGSGRRLLAGTSEEFAKVVDRLLGEWASRGDASRESTRGPMVVIVADVGGLAGADTAGVRHLLGGRGPAAAGVVLTDERDELPAECTKVIAVSGHRGLVAGADGEVLVAVAGAVEPAARGIARSLARFDDPDAAEAGSELPGTVRLLDLLGLSAPCPDVIAERWSDAGRRVPLATLGVTEFGLLEVDLVRDGPHGLLAGTTGAGKSELLRTLVASLAANVSPERLNFVLIDYKGGSAFDACATLPHTVGLVTDLDGRLAERALRCLEAELRHREQLLREAGADDLDAYTPVAREPLARLLIVVDEFAALARELPEFMDALVDIAARGRSLGVHLLLATQRPAGVIRDAVRANTNVRIALRVQDTADSQDVIGDPRAAAIGRNLPGRGLMRLGPADLVVFQTAHVTGAGQSDRDGRAVRVREFTFGHEPPAPVAEAPGDGTGPSDLELLVAAAMGAARRLGLPAPRRPWPDPLPGTLYLEQLDESGTPDDANGDTWTGVPLGLVDEPDLQRIRTFSWELADGPLALYGSPGSGTTTALMTVAVALVRRHAPEDLHIYAVDHDGGALIALETLPNVGAVVGPGERERAVRLVTMLVDELDRRRRDLGAGRSLSSAPRILLLIDGLDSFSRAFDGLYDAAVRDGMARIIAEGPASGIVAVLTATRANSVPAAVDGNIGTRLVFRLADPLAGAALGVRSVGDLPAGRGVHAGTGRHVQIAMPGRQGIDAVVAAMAGTVVPVGAGGPPPVGVMPHEVKAGDVRHLVRIGDDAPWQLPVGIGESLDVVGLTLDAGDHVLIAGGPRSGKSTLLAALAELVTSHDTAVAVTAVTPRRSALGGAAGSVSVVNRAERVPEVAAEVLAADGPQLVLVDDADDLDGAGLRDLVAARRPHVHVVAAVRPEVKSVYDHWTKAVAISRLGLWLRPSQGVDADLWRTPLPRRIPDQTPPGRGLLIADGSVEVVQTVRP